jgi:hypothetical protein
MTNPYDALIDRSDIDGLVRIVDGFCASRQWPELLALRNACKAATQAGRQLWPVSTLAEYRLALLAPAKEAAQVLVEEVGRFTLGPLTEVIAQHHQWSELSQFLQPSPTATFIAYECAMRGQHIEGELFPALESPLRLLEVESEYALAQYLDNEAKFATPMLPSMGTPVSVPNTSAITANDSKVAVAIQQLVDPWTSQSNGKLQMSCVDGSILDALAKLDVAEVRLALLSPSNALAWLTWAGASGGAHGRRRGNALGRDTAWWTIAALTEQTSRWPLNDSILEESVEALQWFWWDTNEPASGWQLHLCIHDAGRNRSWAMSVDDWK